MEQLAYAFEQTAVLWGFLGLLGAALVIEEVLVKVRK